MLEARVEMCLQPETPNHAVVVAVDVGVDSVETLEDLADCGEEVGREGNAGLSGEEIRVGEIGGGPGEEVGDVGWGWETGGLWEVGWVVPEVLESEEMFSWT